MDDITRIGFGGGCHWCTEAVFQALRGVRCVKQGFIRSVPPYDTFSEAVSITFNPAIIPLSVLMDIHLRTHASGSNHSMRGKYRSAIYVHNPEQGEQVRRVLKGLQEGFNTPRITRVLEFKAFKESEARFQNYYENGPERPFCTRYIDPKLTLLRQEYGQYLSD